MNDLTNEQVKNLYNAKSIICSYAFEIYKESEKLNGFNHPITQYLWDNYLTADLDAQPFRVKMGQISMQEQIDFN